MLGISQYGENAGFNKRGRLAMRVGRIQSKGLALKLRCSVKTVSVLEHFLHSP